MIGALLLGWVLSWFGFDDLYIKGFREIFSRDLSVAGYYLSFFLFGCIWELTKLVVEGGK